MARHSFGIGRVDITTFSHPKATVVGNCIVVENPTELERQQVEDLVKTLPPKKTIEQRVTALEGK